MTTTTGLPSLSQQFSSDDAAFQSAVTNAQSAADRLPATSTVSQVAVSMQPLLGAADLFQSQIVNLQWSSAAKPLSQTLSEDIGQLTAVLQGIIRPGGFGSVGQFQSSLRSAAAKVHSASKAVAAAVKGS